MILDVSTLYFVTLLSCVLSKTLESLRVKQQISHSILDAHESQNLFRLAKDLQLLLCYKKNQLQHCFGRCLTTVTDICDCTATATDSFRDALATPIHYSTCHYLPERDRYQIPLIAELLPINNCIATSTEKNISSHHCYKGVNLYKSVNSETSNMLIIYMRINAANHTDRYNWCAAGRRVATNFTSLNIIHSNLR